MFKYLFYRIFRFQNNVIGEEKSTAAFTAFLSVAIFWCSNLFAIFIVLDKDLDLLLFFDNLVYKPNILVPGCVLAIIGLISYFCFYHNSKYKIIVNEIESNDFSVNRKYNLWSIVYQIASLLIIIGAIIFRFM